MYHVQYLNETLSVNKDLSPIMENIRVNLKLEKADSVNLVQTDFHVTEKDDQHGTYTVYETIYQDKENDMQLSLILHCESNIMQAFVKVHIHHEELFHQNKYLASEDSIVITVDGIGEVDGLLGHYLHKDWWSRPHFNPDITTLPPRTQSLLWKNKETYHYLVPLIEDNYQTMLRGTKTGLEIYSSSFDAGRNKEEIPVFVMGHASQPFSLAKQVMQSALDTCGGKTLAERQYPQAFEYLGWCSWDAFYKDVNEQGIIAKANEFREKNLPVKWMLIDDGWSMTENMKLTSFKEDPEKFPSGLNKLTSDLKQKYHIDFVGVWHTIVGYWGGIDPESAIAEDMASHLYETNSHKLIPYPDKGLGYGFWDAWHTYLEAQGIDFVKVDGQSSINNFMSYEMSIGQSARVVHKALEASVGNHFNHTMINCMGMAQENMFNRPLSAVSRTSDDFVPEVADSFAEHALQNAYNSFYHGEIFWGDWDMFWTNHPDAIRHALLRAVSGGPIYTSDRVKETDEHVLRPLIYDDGKIIRCDRPGKPTQDLLMKDPINEPIPLKVQNVSNGAGVLAAFHLNKEVEQISGTFQPSDIPELSAEEYIVYDVFNQYVNKLKKDDREEITLTKDGYALYLVVPKVAGVTPIGLVNKYISVATFEKLYATNEKHVFSVKSKGEFAFVCDIAPKRILVNGIKAEFQKHCDNKNTFVVTCPNLGKNIVEIEM